MRAASESKNNVAPSSSLEYQDIFFLWLKNIIHKLLNFVQVPTVSSFFHLTHAFYCYTASQQGNFRK